jgi:NAD(P)-dependent dehydrogenase (short-subunit alcohol dehydrogenase family)
MANGLIEVLGGSDELAKSTPSGRLGEPEDIAGAVVFLASRAANHVTGAVLTIDGGEVLAHGMLTESREEKAKL